MPSPLIGPLGMPTADHVARAIMAACREIGADPIAVARGDLDHVSGYARSERTHVLARSRAYAAYALLKVFGGPKQAIARMVGVKRDSASGYFQAIDRRGGMAQGWCVPVAFARVVAAVEASNEVEKIDMRPDWAMPELNEIKPVVPKRPSVAPAPQKYAIRPEVELESDDGAVFDASPLGITRRHNIDGLIAGKRPMSKAEMAADLAAALANTARMAPREESNE